MKFFFTISSSTVTRVIFDKKGNGQHVLLYFGFRWNRVCQNFQKYQCVILAYESPGVKSEGVLFKNRVCQSFQKYQCVILALQIPENKKRGQNFLPELSITEFLKVPMRDFGKNNFVWIQSKNGFGNLKCQNHALVLLETLAYSVLSKSKVAAFFRTSEKREQLHWWFTDSLWEFVDVPKWNPKLICFPSYSISAG